MPQKAWDKGLRSIRDTVDNKRDKYLLRFYPHFSPQLFRRCTH